MYVHQASGVMLSGHMIVAAMRTVAIDSDLPEYKPNCVSGIISFYLP